jgi:hypothetical protein
MSHEDSGEAQAGSVALCEMCGDPLLEGVYGWCLDCDTEKKRHGECPQCDPWGYGAFPGGDPRLFSPDGECSTEEEREAHAADCLAWGRGERPRVKTCGYEVYQGSVVHVFRAAYGLGSYTFRCQAHA